MVANPSIEAGSFSVDMIGRSTASLIFDRVAASGHSRSELAALAGVDITAASDSDRLVPFSVTARVYEAASLITGDNHLGLHVAESFDMRSFGAMGYAVLAATTLRDAALRVARYHAIFTPAVAWRLTEEKGSSTMEFLIQDPHVSADRVRQISEFSVAMLVLFARRRAAASVQLDCVEFRHSEIADISEYKRIFGCPVEFCSAINGIRLARHWLDVPLSDFEPTLSEIVTGHAERSLRELPKSSTTVAEIVRILAKDLPRGSATLDEVAKRMNVSARTLQRRLADQQTSLSAVLDMTRRQAVLGYLEDGHSPGEITYLVGLSDVRALHRAFKRWTGKTINEYRLGWIRKVSIAD